MLLLCENKLQQKISLKISRRATVTEVLRYVCTHLILISPYRLVFWKEITKTKKGPGYYICTATSTGVFDEETRTLIYSLRADVSKYRPEVYKTEKSKILKKIHKVALGKLLT